MKIKNNQQGIVSIVVTMIILIILSLVVTGFAQLARREQRDSLDRQLNTQAYYAAESGVNAAVNAINAPVGSNAYSKLNANPANKDNCPNDSSGILGSGSNILGDPSIQYTCLLIDQKPRKLEYSAIETTKSTVIPIHAVDNVTGADSIFDSITIGWQNSDNSGGSFPATTAGFPALSAWSASYAAPVLRIDIIPSGSAISRNLLLDNTFTAFLYPSSGGGTIAYSSGIGANQGAIVSGNCDNANPALNRKKCEVVISGLNRTDYYLRVKSVYKQASATVSAKDAGNQIIRIRGAQAEIDSTGKAGDVLRRIRVRVPSTNTNFEYPEGAMDSADSICKRLLATPDSTTSQCTGP